jgi:hypothetical protein
VLGQQFEELKMSKYRTTGHDVMPPPPKAKPVKPGTIAPGKVGVFDDKGRCRGVMGTKAGAATAARFLGHSNVKLGKVDGRDAWVATAPSKSTNKAATAQNAKLAAQLRGDKGSNP